MRRAVIFIAGLLFGVGAAWAVNTGFVTSAITYVAGDTRPITLTTSGDLRVDCN